MMFSDGNSILVMIGIKCGIRGCVVLNGIRMSKK